MQASNKNQTKCATKFAERKLPEEFNAQQSGELGTLQNKSSLLLITLIRIFFQVYFFQLLQIDHLVFLFFQTDKREAFPVYCDMANGG